MAIFRTPLCLVVLLTTALLVFAKSATDANANSGSSIRPEYAKPTQPQDFHVSSKRASTVELVWKQPKEWNGQGYGYEISCNSTAIRLIGVTENSFTFFFLIPLTNYTFQVKSISKNGDQEVESDPATLVVKTAEFDEPTQPQDFRVSSLRSNSVILVWKQPNEWNGPETGYEVTYLNVPIRLMGARSTTFTASRLQPLTNYSFQLKAISRHGDIEMESVPVTLDVQTSGPDGPSPPRNFRMDVWTVNEIILAWDEPKEPHEVVAGYIISVYDEKALLYTVKRIGRSNTRFGPVRLEFWHHYNFQLQAYNVISGKELIGSPVFLDVDLPVPSRPAKPVSFRPGKINSTSIEVTWAAPKANIDGYVVFHDANQDPHFDFLHGTSYVLFGLQPWTWYNVSVATYKRTDFLVVLSDTASTKAQTKIAAPSEPLLFQAVNIDTTKVTLKWSAPSFPNGPKPSYYLCWSNYVDFYEVLNDTKYTVESLNVWTNYTFTLYAFNEEDGARLKSKPVKIMVPTAVSEPSEPVSPEVWNVTDSSFTLSWGKPTKPNGPIDGYVLTCTDVHSGTTCYAKTTIESYTFEDLLPWTEYNISLVAFNTAVKDGKSTYIVGPPVNASAQTNPGEPGAPTNLTVKDITNTSLVLTWEDPDKLNGPLSGYQISFHDFKGNHSQVSSSQAGQANETTWDSILNNLVPFTYYNISVSFYNILTEGTNETYLYGESTNILAQTKTSAPPNPVVNITVPSTDKQTATLMIPNEIFSSNYGSIIEYMLLLARSDSESITEMKGFGKLNESEFPGWGQAKGTNQWYRISPVNWDFTTDKGLCDSDEGSKKCLLGSENCDSKKAVFCNGPLNSNTLYWAKLRAYTNAGWTETFPVKFVTAPNMGTKSSAGILILIMSLLAKYIL